MFEKGHDLYANRGFTFDMHHENKQHDLLCHYE